MKRLALIGIFIWFGTGFAAAQAVSDFTLKDVNDGKNASLKDYRKSKGVAVIFTSNVCPYAVYYEGRITQLIAEYEDKDIQFLLINSHQENKESEEEMVNKISAWGLTVPYLADKDQIVLSTFGAKKSPEVFLLKPVKDSFAVVYKGAIDNNPQVESDVKEKYLKNNIELLLNGEPATAGERPIGCIIKLK